MGSEKASSALLLAVRDRALTRYRSNPCPLLALGDIAARPPDSAFGGKRTSELYAAPH